MKVFLVFLNQNFQEGFPRVEKERISTFGWENPSTEVEGEECSRSTSSLLIALMIHPDRTTSKPDLTNTRS